MDFFATLKPNGQLIIHRRKSMDNWLASLAGPENIPFTVTIEKTKRRRSQPANRYYWGQVIPIIQRGLNDLGHDLSKEETHVFLTTNFGYSEIINEDTGEVTRIPAKTSKMEPREFNQYIELVCRFAAEQLHEVIPMPNEQKEIDY